jgi:phage gp29-like protein
MAEDINKKPEIQEIATTRKDFDVFGGWLLRLENPDPTLRSEAMGKGLKLYDEVDRDPHAGSVLQTRYLSVVGKEWSIEPGKSGLKNGQPIATPQDEEISGFVKQTLEACNFDQIRMELLQAVLYGFFAAEVMWAVRDGQYVIDKFYSKHPRRFCFDLDRNPRLLTLDNMIVGDLLPERKFIVFTFGSSDNPYGKGLGSSLWWPVWFKKNGIKFWLTFLDKFGMPTGVGKYPAGTLKEEQDKLLEAIGLIHSETGVIVPDNMAVELLEAARSGQVTYESLCQFMDRSISKRVIGQTASTEGTPGKLGNEQAQDDVRQEIVEADSDLLDACLNATVIRWLVDYNYPGVISYPKIETFAGKKPDLTAKSAIDKIVVGDLGLPVSKKYFYETYNIPEPEDGEDLLEVPAKTPQNPQIAPAAPGPAKAPAVFAEAQRGANGGERHPAEMINQLDDYAAQYMDGMINQVKDLVMSSGSYDELRDGILKLSKSMDASALGTLMQQAFVAAELSGRYDVKEGNN